MHALSNDSGNCLCPKGGCTLTIVVANYNHGHFLSRCLEAILAQTQPPNEILVIDDASTDNSPEIIADFYSRMPALRIVRHTVNKGVVATMNEGLAKANSTHVLFAAADDWIEPELVANSMRLIEEFPGVGLCSALTRLANEAGSVIGPFRTRIPMRKAGYISPQRAARLLVDDDAWFNGNTTIVNRAAALKAGGYRPELNAYADGFLNVTLALQFGACFIPCFLGVWRRLPAGFAAALVVNPDAMKSTFDAIRRLMASFEPKIFEPQYIARWAARWRFTAARGVMQADLPRAQDWLRESSPAIGMAISEIARIPLIGIPVAIVLLFVVLRPRDIVPVLKRRIAWIFLENFLMRAS